MGGQMNSRKKAQGFVGAHVSCAQETGVWHKRPYTFTREGFTLIELLVVIAIIGILAGMVFKLMSLVTRSKDKAECIQMLECISHALEEYRAEYGQYPPVTKVVYEYANTNKMGPPGQDWLRENYAWDGDNEILFDYGLVAYLWPRDQETISDRLKILPSGDGHPGVNWIGDVPRDENAKARWNPFISDIELEDDTFQSRITKVGIPYSNSTETIEDSWGNEIHYECPAPFLSYRLWSDGPGPGTDDDIHRDKWDN